MNSPVKVICGTLLALVVSFSVLACAYASVADMTMGSMTLPHSMEAVPGHIDHAVSLTLAVAPLLTFLVLAVGFIFVLLYVISLVAPRIFGANTSFASILPFQRLLFRQWSSPRAPPVY